MKIPKIAPATFNVIVVTVATVLAAIAGYISFFQPTLSPVPAAGPLSIEFHRLRSSASMPYLFKMMEGAVIVDYPAFGPSGRQLRDADGNSFGVLTKEFEALADAFPFSNHIPAKTPLWEHFSGSSHARDFAEIIAAQDVRDRGVTFESTAKNLICAMEFSEMNEDGSGGVKDETAQQMFGIDKQGLCRILEYRPYSYYFTAVTLENHTQHVITNVWIDHTSYVFPFTIDTYYEELSTRFKELHPELACTKANDRCSAQTIEASIQSDISYLAYLAELDASPQSETTQSLGISNIPPGKEIFILLNLYKPDETGLPERYFMSRTEINAIHYSVDGQEYHELNPAPLGAQRFGLITTANGGVGGQ